MTHWYISATVASVALLIGILLGALLWQWRLSGSSARAAGQRNSPAPLLWDIHSILNAMNKLALVAERGRPAEPSLIYLLSDYLLHGALIQREDGWTDRNSLEDWLLSHVRVLADHRGQNTLPAVIVQMREDVQRIHAHPPLRPLLWILQKVPSVSRIQIDVFALKAEKFAAKVRIEVTAERSELARVLDGDSAANAWRMEAGSCICELRTTYEPAT